MKKHISKTVSTCYYHLRKLYHLRRPVSQSIVKQLVTSFVLQRIDYCNSLLVNFLASTTASLQRVQKDAALSYLVLIDGLSYYTCIEKKLHWLPIQYRIQFKIAVFMHQCFHCRCPQYIFDLVSFRTVTGRLRSATRSAVTHRPRANLG